MRNSKVVGAISGSTEILSPATFNSYLNVIEAFLSWAAREFIPKNTPEREITLAVENARNKIKRAFSNNKMGGRNAHKTGLTEEELTLLRNVIDPQSPENPFKPACRFRNKLILELLGLTGVRRGELLKLKISHLPQGSKQTLTVMRLPGDQSDPRRNEPQVKTFGREIPLSKTFAKMLWEYVEKHRIKGKHQFLFTSHQNGAPLNLSTVNAIFAQIVKKLTAFERTAAPACSAAYVQ